MRFKELIVIILLLLFSQSFFCASAEELIPYQLQEKWGYANNEMEVALPPLWDYASYFRFSKTAVVGMKQQSGEYLYGLIDVNGNYLVPCEYYISDGESEAFFGGEDGYYLIMNPQRTLCGYYDMSNDFFCEPIFEDVDVWYKNPQNIISVAPTGIEGRIYINAITGEQVGTENYLETFPWHDNAAICMSFDGRRWIQFLDGTRIEVPREYDIASDLSHGLFIVINQEGLYSLMNLKAVIVAEWYSMIELTAKGDFCGEGTKYSGIIYCQKP